MQEFTNELAQLQKQVARLHKLESMLSSMASDKAILAEEELTLRQLSEKEKREVEALERVSVSSIISSIAGNKEAKLRQEQAEAYAAALKHSNVARQLTQLETDISQTKQEIEVLSACEEQFQTAVQEKLAALKAAGDPSSDKIYKLEEQIAFIENQQQEIVEARAAGQETLQAITDIEKELSGAESWGMLDMFGGGLMTSVIKHSHLDNTQRKIDHLQDLLSRFHTELSDIRVTADIQVQTTDFLRFADYFFDNLFIDWMVQDQINATQRQIAQLEQEVSDIDQDLEQLAERMEREKQAIATELEQVALSRG